MSRYSPTVLPTAANPFTAALSSAFDESQAIRERRRQQKAADEALGLQRQAAADRHTAAEANLYAQGYRNPSDTASEPVPAAGIAGINDFTPPSSSMLARGLRAGPSITAPAGQPPSGDELAAALRGNLSPGTESAVSTALRTSPTGAPAFAPTQQAAPVKPGLWSAAFDPSTGTFGGTPPAPAALMIAKAVQQRLSNGMVLDPTQTPQAIAARQQEQTAIGQENRRTAAQQAAEVTQQERDYRTLSAIEPDHAAVKNRPFDPSGHLNYSVLLADALKRRETRESAQARASERGPATLHSTTVNPLTKKVEDIYSDGTRRVIRDATPEEVRKATYTTPEHEKYGTFVDPNDPRKPPVFIHEDAAAALGLVPFLKPAAGSVTGPGGKPLPAPMAAKVGQFGEMLKKADDLLQITDALDVGVGQSGARDIAEHGIGIGSFRIPGTKGAGNLLMNQTAAYSKYQAALSPFILAAAHALSGARINQDQVEQIRKSIERAPGDSPDVRAQKDKNLIDLINSIGGSLPADAIGSQEAQMDETAIARMTGRGYRRIGQPATGTGATAPAGAKDATGNIDLSIDLSAKPAISKGEYDELRKTFSDAEIRAKYTVTPVTP